MSITSRWQMDAQIDTELKNQDKSITSRWQMDAEIDNEIDAELKKEEPKAYEKRCVYSKEDNADYLMNSCNYNHNNRDF